MLICNLVSYHNRDSNHKPNRLCMFKRRQANLANIEKTTVPPYIAERRSLKETLIYHVTPDHREQCTEHGY